MPLALLVPGAAATAATAFAGVPQSTPPRLRAPTRGGAAFSAGAGGGVAQEAAESGDVAAATGQARQGLPLAAGAAAAVIAAAGGFLRRRRLARSSAAVALHAEGVQAKRSVAKETLARLRMRAPKKGKAKVVKKKMPPAPDPWELDEENRKIFPWPKSFAEIVQTAAYSAMEMFMTGETRVEVCFPPLPLADLDWNTCDVSQTRVVDSNIQHAIAFSKLIIKDKKLFPKLDSEEAYEAACAGASVEQPDQIEELLERRFKRRESTGDMRRTVRILFPNKPDMLRARDIHYEKWRKMDRPELLRRGYYNEVNEESWPGPFEDVFVYIMCQEAGELPKIRNYVEKADAVAKKQGRVLRHIVFNLNLNKLRSDIYFFKTVVPFRPGLATPKVHFDFLSTFRNAYFIRFGKYTLTVLRDPFNVDYSGAMYHAFPSPWQIFMQDTDGTYRTIDVQEKRPSIICLKRRLQRAFGLSSDTGLVEDRTMDDVYRTEKPVPGTLAKPTNQTLREGFGDAQWWEDEFEEEISDKWRLA